MLPDLGINATKATLLDTMKDHIVIQTELIGTYDKKTTSSKVSK